MDEPSWPPRKLTRQQLRVQARVAYDAEGWIAVMDAEDSELRRANRAAIGPRRVTRSDLELATSTTPRCSATAMSAIACSRVRRARHDWSAWTAGGG
ncbi:MAG: hypothetical protein U0075_10735 [Thermomicrobiales bacterium]